MRVITNAQDYYPYGEVLRSYNNSSPNEKYKFTGKERDTETNLDYFGARFYDSELGRWTTVDPLASKYPAWSTYNYCVDNPLIYVDPNGTFADPIMQGGNDNVGEEDEKTKQAKEEEEKKQKARDLQNTQIGFDVAGYAFVGQEILFNSANLVGTAEGVQPIVTFFKGAGWMAGAASFGCSLMMAKDKIDKKQNALEEIVDAAVSGASLLPGIGWKVGLSYVAVKGLIKATEQQYGPSYSPNVVKEKDFFTPVSSSVRIKIK